MVAWGLPPVLPLPLWGFQAHATATAFMCILGWEPRSLFGKRFTK